jgi:lysophosphatidic acid acyltransferase/lysophosphatidylinositol acyltransferase
MDYPYATWIVVTAEGTRFTKQKHETSMEFAREKNVQPFKHHLIPRARGFSTCVPLLKKFNCPVVYNLQVAFDKNAPNEPTLGNLLLGKKVTAHLYVERIEMAKVEPTFEYLYDVYKKKDELQDSFHKFGNFYDGRGLKAVDGIRMKPRLCVLVNSLCWTVFELCLMTYYTTKLILAGRLILLLTISASVIALCKISLYSHDVTTNQINFILSIFSLHHAAKYSTSV